MLKVEDQKPNALGFQLSTSEVESQKLYALGIQLSTLKVECQEFSSTFYITFFFFYVNWIDPRFVLHSFGLILLVNDCVFKVYFENKVDLVLANVPFNLSILRIFKPISLIFPWNWWVDNFIEFIVVFEDRFLSNKTAIIIMHVDDLQVLKEIRSFLENYQLKVCMKWTVANSSVHMSSKYSSSQVPWITLYPYVFTLCILLKVRILNSTICIDFCKPCHSSCEGSNSRDCVFIEVSIFHPFLLS